MASESSEWFVLLNGKEHGPFTTEQLRECAAHGKLFPDDLVRRSDMQDSKRAADIEGLFTRLQLDGLTAIGTRFPPDPVTGFRPADFGNFTPSDGVWAGLKRVVAGTFFKRPK